MPALHGGSLAERRRVNKALQDQAWSLYLNSVPQHQIARQLDVSETAVSKWIKAKQDAHPAAAMNEKHLNVDCWTGFQQAALAMKVEIAAFKARGEPVPPSLLNLLSVNADRFARWATRQTAVPNVEINATACLDSSAVAHLLGRAPMGGEVMQSAAVGTQALPEA